MTNTSLAQPANCEVVPANFGLPLDQGLMADFPEVSQEIVGQRLSAINAPYDPDLAESPVEVVTAVEIGDKSKQIRRDLGCAACVYSGECSVAKLLGDNIEQASRIEGANTDVSMLSSAPSWLRTVRSRKTGLDIGTPEGEQVVLGKLKSLLTSDIEPAEAEGSSDQTKSELHELLAGVENKTLPDKPIAEMPELVNNLQLLGKKGKEGQSLQGTRIRLEGDNDRQYDVYDATGVVGFKGTPLPVEDVGIITEKFFDRMREVDAKGQAQLATPDGSTQKQLHIRGVPVPKLSELRMNGKNRMYFTYETTGTQTVDQGTGQKTGVNSARIVILGSHGGTASTQSDFLDHIGIA